MSIKLIPWIQPNYNVQYLIELLRQASGVDLSVRDGHPLAYLSKVANVRKSSNVELIRDSAEVQKHFFFSFMLTAPIELTFEILEHTRLEVTRHECKEHAYTDVLIVSGTLDVWTRAVIECSSQNKVKGLVAFANAVQRFFEQYGIGLIFSEYRKVPQKMITYLEKK